MRTARFPHITAVIGITCLIGLALINGDSGGVLAHIAHPIQFALFYAGLALTVWGFIGGRAGFAGYTTGDSPWTRLEIGAVAAIVAFALVLRLWALETSIHVLVDELNPALEVVSLWENPALKILQPIGLYSPFPRLYASWEAMSAVVFGRNLTALRFPSAVLGTLTVAALYFLGRTLFNRRTALIAALLLAVFPPHIHYSRLALLSIGDPLFGTLALAFLARGLHGLRPNHRADWVLGGAALGLTQYFYEGGRLLFPILTVAWITLYLLRNRASFVRWRRGLFTAGAVAVIVALPVYYTLAGVRGAAALRMNVLGVDSSYWGALLVSPPDSPLFDWFVRHITDPILIFTSKPELSPYYGGDGPMILAYVLPALLLGLCWAIRSSGGWLLILWLLGAWFGNILLADSALSPRYLVVFPAIPLIMALGIDQTAQRIPASFRRVLLPAYVTLCVVGQAAYYFGPHLETFNRQIRADTIDTTDAVFRAAALPPGTQVYLLGAHPDMTEDYAQNLLRYLADGIHLTFLPALDGFNFTQPSEQPFAFLIPPDDTTSAQQLAAHVTLPAPQHTPYAVPRAQTYTLYIFPAPD